MDKIHKIIRLKDGRTCLIRPAVPADGAEYLRYLHMISGESDYLSFGVGELTDTPEDVRDSIAAMSTVRNHLSLMALVDGQIVANLTFRGGHRPRTAHVGEFGVSVLKEYWGHRIGPILMEQMIEWAKASGLIRKINLRVRPDNVRGIAIYERFGFQREGVLTRDMVIDGVFYDAVLMGLFIDPC
ncbi:GNAT family N-acetyltransferase [Brevibacillus dissolubilis]|uniref:GNAT family N-acetyltransferase n=1 Tax=Brevibacillus dissolubilis TaxID=1844116 RepID=UPI00111799C2|nr:GNAT family protein [Brevibacillus dissolubilis]